MSETKTETKTRDQILELENQVVAAQAILDGIESTPEAMRDQIRSMAETSLANASTEIEKLQKKLDREESEAFGERKAEIVAEIVKAVGIDQSKYSVSVRKADSTLGALALLTIKANETGSELITAFSAETKTDHVVVVRPVGPAKGSNGMGKANGETFCGLIVDAIGAKNAIKIGESYKVPKALDLILKRNDGSALVGAYHAHEGSISGPSTVLPKLIDLGKGKIKVNRNLDGSIVFEEFDPTGLRESLKAHKDRKAERARAIQQEKDQAEARAAVANGGTETETETETDPETDQGDK